jgi:Na+-driven multidrug efflux pump
VQLLKTNRKLLADFFRHGTPVILGDILWGLAGTLHIAIMGRMGEAAMAANSISNVMFQVVTVIVFSCAGASGVIIGKTVGSGKYDLVKQYARTLQLLFLGIALTTSAIFFCLRDVFISFYDFSLDTQAIARQFMTIMSISIIGTGYHAPSFTGIIRAGGDTKFVLIVDFICAWLIVLPSAYLAAFVFAQPPWIVFLCLRSDQFFKWIVAIIKTNSFTWIKNLTRDNLETAGQTAQKVKRVGD